MDLLLGHICIMLGGKHYCLQTVGLVIFIILHCHLALSVGSQIGKGPVLTNLGELPRKLMCQRNGKRHILLCLIGSIAEHHALVSCADSI